ncbi:MAG: uncharacterized protein QOG62_921 [Thermoleophilaceae bacterium]|jgi:pimeloyl-ACP methyl ester carboxylesterase|nr:uncharacterized protein [Thermoleophilaceae bacterium]
MLAAMAGVERTTISFTSGGERCAAWLYRPAEASGATPCVVMANGLSLTLNDGLDVYARAFAEVGSAVLAFDHRCLGDSGGNPRGRIRIGAQLEDWRNAVATARGLDGVDPARIVTWGFSLAGGHAVTTAANDDDIAGTILLCPMLDGLARVTDTPPKLAAKLTVLGLAELAGIRRSIQVTGHDGDTAIMTFEGESDGFERAVPEGSNWLNETLPALLLRAPTYRPVRHAARFNRPTYISMGERDISVSNPAIERFAKRAPNATLDRFDGDHFDPLTPPIAPGLAESQAGFLRDHIVAA